MRNCVHVGSKKDKPGSVGNQEIYSTFIKDQHNCNDIWNSKILGPDLISTNRMPKPRTLDKLLF